MRTHEFARHLEQLARLLRQLPDTELDQKDALSFQDVLPGVALPKKSPGQPPKQLPMDIEARLESMSPVEIEKFLMSDEEGFTTANLSELLRRIGLTSSKRQSKTALVNMIARHYEASKMHSIMRGSGPNEA